MRCWIWFVPGETWATGLVLWGICLSALGVWVIYSHGKHCYLCIRGVDELFFEPGSKWMKWKLQFYDLLLVDSSLSYTAVA